MTISEVAALRRVVFQHFSFAGFLLRGGREVRHQKLVRRALVYVTTTVRAFRTRGVADSSREADRVSHLRALESDALSSSDGKEYSSLTRAVLGQQRSSNVPQKRDQCQLVLRFRCTRCLMDVPVVHG